MSPPKEVSPGTKSGATTEEPLSSTPQVKTTTIPGLQRHEPLTAEDRADAAVLAAAAARGYKLAVPCTRCGQFLTAARSVALHLGPVCAAKMAVAE